MELDFGSKSWGDVQKDKHEYNFQASFPESSPARTTFHAKDVRDIGKENKFNRLFSYQHGRGHTYEGWKGQRVRPENEFTHRRACVILSQVGVTGEVRKLALQKVMKENLTGFSRYYEGIDGAAIGFASLFRYSTKTEAINSYLVDKAEELLDINGEKLIRYVWRKFGPVIG